MDRGEKLMNPVLRAQCVGRFTHAGSHMATTRNVWVP